MALPYLPGLSVVHLLAVGATRVVWDAYVSATSSWLPSETYCVHDTENYDHAWQSKVTNLLPLTCTSYMNPNNTRNDRWCDSRLLNHARSRCSVVAAYVIGGEFLLFLRLYLLLPTHTIEEKLLLI